MRDAAGSGIPGVEQHLNRERVADAERHMSGRGGVPESAHEQQVDAGSSVEAKATTLAGASHHVPAKEHLGAGDRRERRCFQDFANRSGPLRSSQARAARRYQEGGAPDDARPRYGVPKNEW